MLSTLDISASALVAQRTRMAAIASNIANISTTHNEAGQAEPYQPRFTVFQTDDSFKAPLGAAGVRVESVQVANVEPNYKYQPGHPDAIKEGPKTGYVAYPAVNMMAEFADALEATRAYEANIGVIEVSKEFIMQSLKIVA
jgi:flagellar basal-body rod protein FlgC